MRTRLESAIRGESGKVFILVLALLVVGGLILGPLLGLMSTGLVAGQVYEKKTAQLYAADAGIQDGIWKIQNADIAGLPGSPCGDEPWDHAYDIPEAINGNHVHVSIVYLGGGTHRVNSTAADEDGQTTVESYVKATLKPLGQWDWDEVVPVGGQYSGGKIEKGVRVYAEGDLTVDGIIEDDAFVYVKGNLTVEKIEDGSTVYVEGDLLVTESMAEDDVKVCVLGNAWIPKIETGRDKDSVEVYVEGDLTVYVKEGLQGSGDIQDDDTVVCVGGQLVVEGDIEDNPTIHASGDGFEPFDECPICCWGCLQLEYELVLEVSSYQIGSCA